MRVTLEFDQGNAQAVAFFRALRSTTREPTPRRRRGLTPMDLPHLAFDGLELVVRRLVCAVIK